MKHIHRIVLYGTSVCNARCVFCDIGQDLGRGMQKLSRKKEAFMSMDILNRILDDPAIKGRKIGFYMSMTEPLLNPDLPEMVKAIKNRGHSMGIATNGYLLPEKADALFEAGLDDIQISIDGPPRVHNKLRGLKDIYQKAVKGIKRLNELNESGRKIGINVSYAVSNLNHDCIEEFVDTINKRVKLDELKIQLLNFVSEEMSEKHNKLYGIKQTECIITDIIDPEKIDVDVLEQELRKVKSKKYENIKKIRFIPDIHTEKDLQKYFNKQGEVFKKCSMCTLPWWQVAVATNGDVTFHVRCLDYKLGNIKQNTIKEIFNNKRAEFFRKELKNAKFCFPVCTRCCGVMPYS